MVEEHAVSLFVNLAATGITAGTTVTAQAARDILRRRKYSTELEHAATEFSDALKEAVEAKAAREDTGELVNVADDWPPTNTPETGYQGESAKEPVRLRADRRR